MLKCPRAQHNVLRECTAIRLIGEIAVKCPRCGAENPEAAMFCQLCGKPFDEGDHRLQIVRDWHLEDIPPPQHRAAFFAFQTVTIIVLFIGYILLSHVWVLPGILMEGAALVAVAVVARHFLSPCSIPGSSAMLTAFLIIEVLIAISLLYGIILSAVYPGYSADPSTAHIAAVIGGLIMADSSALYWREFRNHKRSRKRSRSDSRGT